MTIRERTRDVIEETIGLVIGVTQGVLLNMTLLATYILVDYSLSIIGICTDTRPYEKINRTLCMRL